MRGVGGHHDLTRPVRIRQTALHDGEAVLVEQQSVHAARWNRIAEPAQTGGAVLGQRQNIRSEKRSRRSYVR